MKLGSAHGTAGAGFMKNVGKGYHSMARTMADNGMPMLFQATFTIRAASSGPVRNSIASFSGGSSNSGHVIFV